MSTQAEENQTLLMMVLKQHYKDRPNVLDDALKVIKEYSNKEFNESEYDKTLHYLKEKMNDLLPNILLYFLTMVPLPKNTMCKSTLMDVIKKSQNSINENIRPTLLNYLDKKQAPPPLAPIAKKSEQKPPSKEEVLIDDTSDSSDEEHYKGDSSLEETKDDPDFVKPVKIVKTQRKITHRGKPTCKSLLDICAEYTVKNLKDIQKVCKKRKEKAWKLLNEHDLSGNNLRKCYSVIEDLNKKEKLLRAIDNEEITHELLSEEYGDGEAFLKEQHVIDLLKVDPFELQNVLGDAIDQFIKSYT